MSERLRAEDVREALELADNSYDGTDYLSDWLVIQRDKNGDWPEWAAVMVTAVTPSFNSHLLNENIGFALLDALADRSPMTLIDALIADGGQIKEAWDLDDGSEGTDDLVVMYFDQPGRYLVFPIPVESAEAKEVTSD